MLLVLYSPFGYTFTFSDIVVLFIYINMPRFNSMHFISWSNNGVVDILPASYCSVIHVCVHSYILITISP